MEPRDKKEEDRPAAYPKPTETEQKLENQQEYIDKETNKYNKKR